MDKFLFHVAPYLEDPLLESSYSLLITVYTVLYQYPTARLYRSFYSYLGAMFPGTPRHQHLLKIRRRGPGCGQ